MYSNSMLPRSSFEFLFRTVLKVMAKLNVVILMNVELESIHVIKMLLASTNKETLIANVSADSVAMVLIVRISTNAINRMLFNTAADREKHVKIFLDLSDVPLVVLDCN